MPLSLSFFNAALTSASIFLKTSSKDGFSALAWDEEGKRNRFAIKMVANRRVVFDFIPLG
jgi:hypothetical protein